MTERELNAHTFYGLPQDMYGEGYRLDFENMKQTTKLNGDISLSFPVICPDGTPMAIKGAIRTEGMLVQKITTTPIDNV